MIFLLDLEHQSKAEEIMFYVRQIFYLRVKDSDLVSRTGIQ